MTKRRVVVAAVATSLVTNLVLVVGIALLLGGGSPASTISQHLHLATHDQAATAQATAEDAESQILDAQDQIAQATGTNGSLADAISAIQGSIDDLQSANDDLDGRLAVVESSREAACSWARQQSLQNIGSDLFYVFNSYSLNVC